MKEIEGGETVSGHLVDLGLGTNFDNLPEDWFTILDNMGKGNKFTKAVKIEVLRNVLRRTIMAGSFPQNCFETYVRSNGTLCKMCGENFLGRGTEKTIKTGYEKDHVVARENFFIKVWNDFWDKSPNYIDLTHKNKRLIVEACNSTTNMQLLCAEPCHKTKTKEDSNLQAFTFPKEWATNEKYT